MTDLNLRVIIGAVTDGIRNGINEVETRLGAMGRNITSAFTSIQTLISVSLVGVMIHAAVGIARGFDVINASIKTATKGLQNEAIPALKDFAKTTPYDLAQVSEAFVKLVNFGLTPSEAALTSYGNTASALGKNLNQMVEAVADAVTGEFERLKEFGIKSKVEGDNVVFTFQGVKTTVKNNAADIEKYLIRLGEVNFAGAMTDRAKTLDGALSNLSDSWNNLVLTVMQSGFSDFIAESARSASGSLDGISKYIESGVLQANIATITTAFDGMGRDVVQSMGIVTAYIKQQFAEWSAAGKDSAHTLTTEFQNWMNNTRSFIKIMTVEVASMWDTVKILTDSSLQSMRKPMEAQQERLEGINKARQDSISSILDEHATQKAANKDAIDASDAIVKSLEREAAAHAKNETDRLAKFKIGGSPTDSAGSGKKKKEKKPKAPPVESEMHGFDFGLEQQKIAFEKSNALLDFSKEAEKAYWDNIIANYKGNAKTLADLKKKSADLELGIIRDNAKLKQDVQKEAIDSEHAAALDELGVKEAASQQQLELGNITQEQHLANLRNFAAERLAIEQKSLDDYRKLLGDDALALAQNLHQKEAFERASAAKIKAIETQEKLSKKEHFKQMFAPFTNALEQMTNGILTGQQTVKKAIQNVAQSMVVSYAASFIKTGALAAASWAWELTGHTAKEQAKVGETIIGETECTVATAAGAEARDGIEIMAAAKSSIRMAWLAAKGAFSSVMAWVPFPLNVVLAPIAGAAAFMGTMALGSAKGGEWQVGKDGSPYILHEKESVLPAGVAENFRKVVGIVNGHVEAPNHIAVIDELFASGKIAKNLALPSFALNMTTQSQSAANALVRDRLSVDSERKSAASKAGETHIHMNGLMLAPEDFLKQQGKTLARIAKDEARKFNTGKR
ncbi:MAG: hypothetical protein EPN17_01025 [Methylobacter sp.]|nr:MAG: hypothetical protein EPN17_01025 [Methylobacter sp.]